MSKVRKKLLSVALCFALLFVNVAIGDAEVYADKGDKSYSVGDMIYFGTYPQTDVTDSLGSVLNSQNGIWKSYNYYRGTGKLADGQMIAIDYMRYKDITYNGNKYRGVTFDSYRPYATGVTSDRNEQQGNGYIAGTTYWFKFDPVKWRALDPSSGLIMCDSIIDSQPYNNFIISYSTDGHAYTAYWGDSTKTYYANNYARSSIRQWLNNDFYNTAFSDEQKSSIMTTTLNNDCYYTLTGSTGYEEYDAPSTSDKVFLLSYDQVTNNEYGFDSTVFKNDTARRLHGSDYAKCQGLYVLRDSESSYDGNSYWWLRSPYSSSEGANIVYYDGDACYGNNVSSTCSGVVPALRLGDIAVFTATFMADGEIVEIVKFTQNQTIITEPKFTEKDGYTFKGWSPAVPENMPASDMTFTAVFEKNSDNTPTEPEKPTKSDETTKPDKQTNPTASAKIKVKSDSVYKNSKVTVTAKAEGVPKGYYLAVFDGKTEVERGTNSSVTYEIKELVSRDKKLTVKVIDKDGNVQKNAKGEKLTDTINITVKTGFFDVIIAFFKKLFGSNKAYISA